MHPRLPFPGSHQIRYDAQVRLTQQGNIEIETHMVGIDGIAHTISRKLVELENEAVRSALIALGWTPPTTP